MSTRNMNFAKRGINKDRLTDRQRMFCEAYLESMNVVQAAKEAGYKNKSAGHKLINHPLVKVYIGNELRKRSESHRLTAVEVLKHLTNALFLDPAEFFRFDHNGVYCLKNLADIPEDIRRCIKRWKVRTRTYGRGDESATEMTVEVELMDKDHCLEMAMKHLGMLNDKFGNTANPELGAGFLAELLQQVERNQQVVDDRFIAGVVDAALPALPAPKQP